MTIASHLWTLDLAQKSGSVPCFNGVASADDAAALLTKISEEASLRYAIHLITAAYLLAQRRKATKVDAEDVARAYTLFIDVKRSTQFMMDNQLEYLYNEVPEE